jgi:choice-of-anchor B domain-containing protein
MKLAPPALLALLLLTASAIAQPRVSYHTTLFGALNPDPNSGGRYSAIWGYTAPNGREYALLGGYRGTHIVDVTESPVREVAFIEGEHSGWREMKTYGRYAYVVSEGGGGLQIIDLSALPDRATLVTSDTRHFNTGHTISQEGHFIYVHGSNPDAGANGGTLIFDVGASATAPPLVGTWAERYVHDATIRNDTMWAAAINDGRLDVVYLGANRTDPRLVTDIVYPGAGTHNSDLTTDGHYVMTTDEVGSTGKTLKVWDVSDIGNIRKVADYTHNPGEIIHNVNTKGDLAVVSWYTAGTRILDISVPTDPVEVAYYDTYPGAGNTYAGNWGTYPYFASGKIISSDMQTGLYVFTYDGARRGMISGIVRDEQTGEPVPFAVIEIPSLGRTVTADAEGRYRVTAANDTLSFRASATDHFAASGSFVLTTSGATADITLRPVQYATVVVRALDAQSGAAIGSYAWRALTPVGGGLTNGTAAAPVTFRVPVDNPTSLLVGAWGYLPQTVAVTATSGTVDVRLERGYVDDAELDLGWSREQASDDAAGGRWELGTPIGTFFNSTFIQPETDHSPGAGMSAFITQITGTDASVVGSSDVDEGSTTLTSPTMDLTSYVDPTLSAWLWYTRDRYPRPASTNDTLVVSLSNDGGSTWQVIDRITGTDNEWRQFRYRVAQYMQPTAAMQLRVVASDLGEQSWVEAGLDDFEVLGERISGVDDELAGAAPRVSVRPNPAGIAATIEVSLAGAVQAGRLELFDALGRRVSTVHAGSFRAGTSAFALDVAGLAPGRYTWRLVGATPAPMSGTLSVVR